MMINSYRIQLSHKCTFRTVFSLLPYLHRLGIDTLYLSPSFQTEQEGTNFYKITRFDGFDPSLEPKWYPKIVSFARKHGLSIVLDFVPNHMGLSTENPYFMDLLQKGKKSKAFAMFDIFYEEGQGKIVLPILSKPLKVLIQEGKIFETQDHIIVEGKKFPKQGKGCFFTLEESKYVHQKVNYRRFFDIADLIGFDIFDPYAFEESHRYIFSLYKKGWIDGIRIDHPDGLKYPKKYIEKLQRYIPVVFCEKILQMDEPFPSWGRSGNVGYDTLNYINHLLIDQRKFQEMEKNYRRFTKTKKTKEQILREAKRTVLQKYLVAELNRMSRKMTAWWKSKSPKSVMKNVESFLIDMPVYRTYIDEKNRDVHILKKALANCDVWFQKLFLASLKERRFIQEVILPLQQIMPGVFAKGFEDTYLYRYFPLSSLNEVGSDSNFCGVSVKEFEKRILARSKNARHCMNTLSTHDTKRSLEVRMKIHAIMDEQPLFMQLVEEGEKILHSLPRKMIYLALQTMIGMFPYHFHRTEKDKKRLQAYLVKAYREGKEYSDWMLPKFDNEITMERGIDTLFSLPLKHPFWKTFQRLHHYTAKKGFSLTLTALALKAFLPGVMDHFGGEEMTHLFLVDPDNRSLPPFSRMRKVLFHLDRHKKTKDGIKMLWTHFLMQMRLAKPQLFLSGVFCMKERHNFLHVERKRGRDIAQLCISRDDFSLYSLQLNDLTISPKVFHEMLSAKSTIS